MDARNQATYNYELKLKHSNQPPLQSPRSVGGSDPRNPAAEKGPAQAKSKAKVEQKERGRLGATRRDIAGAHILRWAPAELRSDRKLLHSAE